MKFTKDWLSDHLKTKKNEQQIIEKLNGIGLEVEKVEPIKNELSDFVVAKIIKAEDVDGADKLLRLTLDVGELGTRNVFAGIKSSYKPEDLTDRMVVLVNNLAPREMKFGVSEGMVLASSNDNGIYLISPDKGAEAGMKIK